MELLKFILKLDVIGFIQSHSADDTVQEVSLAPQLLVKLDEPIRKQVYGQKR